MGLRFKRGSQKSTSSSESNTALKIKLRGKDNTPLTMNEMAEVLLEAGRRLREYQTGYRAKFATLYLTMIDEYGEPVRINEANELTIYAYKTAADEHGI